MAAPSPQWLKAFFLLALINVATLAASMALNQWLVRHQAASQRADRRYDHGLEHLARLGTASQQINRPGNDFFATRDLAGERGAMRLAVVTYQSELADGCAEHSLPAACLAGRANLRRLGQQMAEEAEELFAAASRDQLDAAGEHMAAMDRQYALLTQELDALRRSARETYLVTLNEAEQAVRTVVRLEGALGVWTILVMLGFALYGWRLSREARLIVAHQASARDELAHANAELRSSLETLRLAQAHLVSSDRLAVIGTLAAGVAHEINNPLAFLLGNLQFLQQSLDSTLSGDEHEALSEAVTGARRVAAIVADLKTLSRGHNAADRADLTRVLDAAVNIARAQLKHRGELVKCYPALPAVRGSESNLGQVFLNLVVNAVQACPPDATDHRVTVTTRLEPGFAVVGISDTGVGIAAEVKPRIFDAFFTTKAIGVGTGLGLSICQRIVTELGGSIRVDSELGRGSTFWVRLPLDDGQARPA